MAIINVNRKLVEEENAFISVKDRGFRFGDGIFDTFKILNSKPIFLKYHIERIENGLKALRIHFDIKLVEAEIFKTIKANKLKDGFARISITRGEGSRGYLPTNNSPANFVIETMEARKMDTVEGKLCISSYQKPSIKSMPINYKLMQGLNSTLAKLEAKEQNFFDAVLLNEKGNIAECSSSNIFWFKGVELFTPSLDSGCLDGVTRKVVIENYSKVKQSEFSIETLSSANEVFITNSVLGIFPVCEIKGCFENQSKNYRLTNEIAELYNSLLD